MKSIIESLFAGLLENSNIVSKQKNTLSDDSNEDFLSDLNSFLIDDNNKIVNPNAEIKEKSLGIINIDKKVETEILSNEKASSLKFHVSTEEEKKIQKKENILVTKKENILATKKEYNTNEKVTNINIPISQKKIKKLNTVENTDSINKKNDNPAGLKLNLININTKTKKPGRKQKIKTFFKNYLNFNNSKESIANKKVLKFISSNSLNSDILNKEVQPKKSNIILTNKVKENINTNNIEKSNTIFLSKGVDLNLNLDSSENEKSYNFNKSTDSHLKNILDIKSNNVNQRIAEIFERNIKLGNNKFEIEIKPENLGKIEVTVEINGDNVEINMKVDNNSVANLLTESNISLQKSFSSQGLNLSNLNLSYSGQNKFGEESSKKEKKDSSKENIKEEENLELKIEKHYKNNNLVYIKA